MTGPLVAVAVRWPHLLDLHITVPVRGGSDGAAVRAETDQGTFIAEALTAQLADVELLPHDAHFGVAGVADMRVVGPHHRLRMGATRLQHMAERPGRVRIGQVAGF